MYLISFSQDPIFLPPSVFLQGYVTCEIHFNAVTLIIFITYQHLLCVFYRHIIILMTLSELFNIIPKVTYYGAKPVSDPGVFAPELVLFSITLYSLPLKVCVCVCVCVYAHVCRHISMCWTCIHRTSYSPALVWAQGHRERPSVNHMILPTWQMLVHQTLVLNPVD